MIHERLRRDWDDLADVDPLWSILSEPDKRDGRWDLNAFFATGETEIAAVLARGRALGHPARYERALDFGCGVGRVTRAMAAHFAECDGVDISPRMVALARRWNDRGAACRFTVNERPDLGMFSASTFDFVYSRIVLQHLPRAAIAGYVAELVRVLRPHGLLVFELPSFLGRRNRLQGRRRLYALLRRIGVPHAVLYRTLRLTPIRMSFVPEPEITLCVEVHGGRVVAIERLRLPAWLSSTYYASKD